MRLIYSVKIGDYKVPEFILDSHKEYATLCGANYTLDVGYYYDFFKTTLRQLDPNISEFQIINNYKIFLLGKFSFAYDEILFLDLDVYVNTKKNFFEEFDLVEGICLGAQTLNHDIYRWLYSDVESINNIYFDPSDRNATIKYALVKSLLLMDGRDIEPKIWNSGVIGINREHIKKLNYFGNDFNNICKEIVDLRSGGGFFMNRIQEQFTIHEEALLSYYTLHNEIPVQELFDDWHHMYFDNTLNKDANFIHFINKRFNDL